MTRTERARLIDQKEFEAECKAVRERAQAYALQRRKEDRAKVLASVQTGPAIAVSQVRDFNVKGPGRRPKLHVVNGISLTLPQWADHLGISRSTLVRRVSALGSMEAVVATRPIQWPGVVSNFAPSDGTGAGSTLQETPNLTFSGNDA